MMQLIGAQCNVGILELALDDVDRAEPGNATAPGRFAARAGSAIGSDARRRCAGIAQLVELANRQRCIAAGDRIAGVEHAAQRPVDRQALRRAKAGAAAADAPAVADAERRGRPR